MSNQTTSTPETLTTANGDALRENVCQAILTDSGCCEAIDAAISSVTREKLSCAGLIQRHDVAHAFAIRLPALRHHRTEWQSAEDCHEVWDSFVKRKLLAGLVWCLACETNPAWRWPSSKLTRESPATGMRDLERRLLEPRRGRDYTGRGLSSFWETYWSPHAKQPFRCTSHPADAICHIGKREEWKERQKIDSLISDPAAPETGPDELTPNGLANIFLTAKPGQLGDLLRQRGFPGLLLASCRKLGTAPYNAPRRAILLWLYHGVATQQRDIIETEFAGTEAHVAQAKKRGAKQFWEAFRQTLLEQRADSKSRNDDDYQTLCETAQIIVQRLEQGDRQ